MSRLLPTLLVLVLFGGLVGCAPAKIKSNKVLIVLPAISEKAVDPVEIDYMLQKEVGVDVEMLKEAGFVPILASPTGKTLGASHQITPDMKLADANVEDYAGIMFPSVAPASTAVTSWVLPYAPEPIRVAQKAAALKKPIAAQVHGIFTLSIAGVMDGKQYALEYGLNKLGPVPYGIYKGEGVVQDGNIFTSGICPYLTLGTSKPDGTKELAQKFIDYLKSNP